MEYERASPITLIEKNQIQYFYDRFFMNRIAVRTLIYQHSRLSNPRTFTCKTCTMIQICLALLFGNELLQHPQQAGIIDPAVDVCGVIKGKYVLRIDRVR
jgi:hypothetical protein